MRLELWHVRMQVYDRPAERDGSRMRCVSSPRREGQVLRWQVKIFPQRGLCRDAFSGRLRLSYEPALALLGGKRLWLG